MKSNEEIEAWQRDLASTACNSGLQQWEITMIRLWIVSVSMGLRDACCGGEMSSLGASKILINNNTYKDILWG